MTTLFDPATRAEGGPITEIDGRPYILDVHLHEFVPYDRPAGIRWAATNYIDGSPEGPVLWHKARLAGTARSVAYAALTEAQALFIATRASLAFDKITARAQIAAAFADWARAHPAVPPAPGLTPEQVSAVTQGLRDPFEQVAAGRHAQALVTPAGVVPDGYTDPVPAPAAAEPDLSEIVHKIGTENDHLSRLLDHRASLDESISASRRRLFDLGNKLPVWLKAVTA